MFAPYESLIHEFLVPFNVGTIGKIIVSYKQNGYIVHEVEASSIEEVDEEHSLATVLIGESSTMKFLENEVCYAQLNLITKDPPQSRLTSKPIKMYIDYQFHKQLEAI